MRAEEKVRWVVTPGAVLAVLERFGPSSFTACNAAVAGSEILAATKAKIEPSVAAALELKESTDGCPSYGCWMTGLPGRLNLGNNWARGLMAVREKRKSATKTTTRAYPADEDHRICEYCLRYVAWKST